MVLISSTDPDELVELCDRVAVFHQGRLCAEPSGADMTQAVLLHAMATGNGYRGGPMTVAIVTGTAALADGFLPCTAT